MNQSPTQPQEKKTRNLAKCTICRQKKVKCKPRDRNWEESQQKCDYCVKHHRPCGPNYKSKEDPVVIGRDNQNVDAQEEGSSQESVRRPINDAPIEQAAGRVFGPVAHNRCEDAQVRPLRPSDTSQGKLPPSSAQDLREKVQSKLNELNALGTTLLLPRSPPPHTHYQCHSPPEPSDVMSIEHKLHLLFIAIYKLSVQAYEQGQNDQARWVLYALMFALDRYPVLCDDRRRGALLKMANMLQDLGHQWECEHILEIMTSMHTASVLPQGEDPCFLLAESLPRTSTIIGRVLTGLWEDTVGDGDAPRHLLVPALQRATHIRNAGVASAILVHQNGVDSTPVMFDQRRLRVSAYLGIPDFIPASQGIDDRDLCQRTALFLAAANGFDQCCSALILGLADPNSRDHHGHTVLEIAARRGHLEVVKELIGVGADINPQLTCCSSSPLQAAIESENLNKELVQYLLDRGASVIIARPCDNRTAIDIAVLRGHPDLAEGMRRRSFDQPHYQFDFGGHNLEQNCF